MNKYKDINFDAMNITKFFKDQQQVKTINKQFTDPFFLQI